MAELNADRALGTKFNVELLKWFGKAEIVKENGNLEDVNLIEVIDNQHVPSATKSKEAIRAQKVKTLQALISGKKSTKRVTVKEKTKKTSSIKKAIVPKKSLDVQSDDDSKQKKAFTQSQTSKSAPYNKMTQKPVDIKKKGQFFAANLPGVPKSTSKPKPAPKVDSRRTKNCMDCSTPIYPRSKRCKECYNAFVKSTSKSSSASVVKETRVNRSLKKQVKPLAIPKKEAVSSGKLKFIVKRSTVREGRKLKPSANKDRMMKKPIGEKSKF